MLVVVFDPVSIKDISQLGNEMPKTLDRFSEVQIEREGPSLLGGREAYEIVETHVSPADPNVRNKAWWIGTVFNNGTTFAMLSMETEEKQFGELQKYFQRMVSSFQLNPTPVTPGYRLQALDELGLTFEYPDNWVKVIEGTERIFINAPIRGGLEHSVGVAVSRAEEIKGLDDVAEQIEGSFKEEAGVKILSSQRINWVGKQTLEINYQRDAGGVLRTGWQLSTVPQPGILLSLTMLSPNPETFKIQEPEFQHIVASSHF